MEVLDFIRRYPRVFHMAERGSWPTIRQWGLLSASAALDRFGFVGDERIALESCHRPEKVTLARGQDRLVLRDQKPMSDSRLEMALSDGTTPREWYENLNRRVFFWVQPERLLTLLGARAYRRSEHDVLTLDTASLVGAHLPRISLCRMNSGNTFPVPHPRGMDDFLRIENYPTKRNGHPLKEVVEMVIDYSVEDIENHVVEVRRMQGDAVLQTLYRRD